MKSPFVFFAALLPLLPACTKSDAERPGPEPAAPATSPRAEPRRNAAESLGIASETTEGYMQPKADEPPAPAPSVVSEAPSPPVALSDPAPMPASSRGVRRTLTATDGRTVDAELLAKSEDAVKIRRAADAREFTIPLEKISEADRAFVRESELPPLAAR